MDQLKKDFKHFSFRDITALFTRKNIDFAATSFGASIIGSIFGLYRVDLFTSVYKLDASYFYSCQIVYAIWNAINDPLFGWIIDHTASGSAKRLPAIKYGGPLWTLAFLLPWWPWADSSGGMFILAVQFCFCLCAYDTFLTYVLLVHCALFADMTTSNLERNQLNLMRTIAGIAGSGVASISYLFWNKEDLTTFRLFCIVMAGVAAYSFYYTGSRLQLDRMDRLQQAKEQLQRTRKDTEKPKLTMWKFFIQLTKHRNFWLYVMLNFMQNLHVTFCNSYWIFFMDKVVEPIFPPYARRLFAFLSLYLPHAMIPLMTPFANTLGKYKVIEFCTLCKIALGGLMTLVPVASWELWGPLFLLNHLLLSSWGFYDIIIADVIDEDMVLNQRTESMSTSIHGIQALFVKPAQSIGPILGVYGLTEYAINHSTKELTQSGVLSSVQNNAYSLFSMITFICGICQYVIWSQYTLHGNRLTKVKRELNSMELELQNGKMENGSALDS